MLLGASHIWFPKIISVLSIPQTASTLYNLVAGQMHRFTQVTTPEILGIVRNSLGPAVADLTGYSECDVWEAVLRGINLCASDPLCSEHLPAGHPATELHGAACHACLFAPETSCEMGNRCLDRATLTETFTDAGFRFFGDA